MTVGRGARRTAAGALLGFGLLAGAAGFVAVSGPAGAQQPPDTTETTPSSAPQPSGDTPATTDASPSTVEPTTTTTDTAPPTTATTQPAPTTTVAETTTTVRRTTTTEDTTETTEDPSTTEATAAPVTTGAPATTTTAPASTLVGSNPATQTTATKDNSQQVLRLVMALLVVVGLLVAVLTWRYWRYTDPRRGLAPSRAHLGAGGGADASEVARRAPRRRRGRSALPPVPEGVQLFGAGEASLPGEPVPAEAADPTDPGFGPYDHARVPSD